MVNNNRNEVLNSSEMTCYLAYRIINEHKLRFTLHQKKP